MNFLNDIKEKMKLCLPALLAMTYLRLFHSPFRRIFFDGLQFSHCDLAQSSAYHQSFCDKLLMVSMSQESAFYKNFLFWLSIKKEVVVGQSKQLQVGDDIENNFNEESRCNSSRSLSGRSSRTYISTPNSERYYSL